jgi:hypothetical protein
VIPENSLVRAVSPLLGAALLIASLAALNASAAVGNVSPDGKWSVAFSRQNGYGRLDLIERSTGKRHRMYRSNDSCCDQITWVMKPHTLVFVDDYNVKTLDPVSRRVVRIAGFSNFVVSPNGRWMAGWASCGGHCAETVEVVPLTGGVCRKVPHRSDQDDSYPFFSRDSRSVTVLRQRFDTKLREPVGSSRQITTQLSALQPVATC